jgi:hypothetical protein
MNQNAKTTIRVEPRMLASDAAAYMTGTMVFIHGAELLA